MIGVCPRPSTCAPVDARLWVPLALRRRSRRPTSATAISAPRPAAPRRLARRGGRPRWRPSPSGWTTVDLRLQRGRGVKVEAFLDRLLGGLPAAAADPARRGRLRAADRLRQRRQPAARPRRRRARGRSPSAPRWGPAAGGSSASCSPRAWCSGLAGGRRGRGPGLRRAPGPGGDQPGRRPAPGDGGDRRARRSPLALALALAASFLFGLVPALRTARPDLQTHAEGRRAEPRLGLAARPHAHRPAGGRGGARAGAAGRRRPADPQRHPAPGGGGRLRSLRRADGAARPPLRRLSGAGPRREPTVQRGGRRASGRIPGVSSAAAASILPLSRNNVVLDARHRGAPGAGGGAAGGSATRGEVTPGLLRHPAHPSRCTAATSRPATAPARRTWWSSTAALARLAWPERGRARQAARLLGRRRDGAGLAAGGGGGGRRPAGRARGRHAAEIYLPLEQANSDLLGGARGRDGARGSRAAGDPASIAARLRRAVLAVDPRLPVFDVLDPGRDPRLPGGDHPLQHAAADRPRGDRPAARGGGDLRRDRLLRQPAHPGDRAADGARRHRAGGARAGGRQAMRPVLLGSPWVSPEPWRRPARSPASSSASPRPIPSTFAGVVLVLAGAALLASWLPARRAARVEPTRALAP